MNLLLEERDKFSTSAGRELEKLLVGRYRFVWKVIGTIVDILPSYSEDYAKNALSGREFEAFVNRILYKSNTDPQPSIKNYWNFLPAGKIFNFQSLGLKLKRTRYACFIDFVPSIET